MNLFCFGVLLGMAASWPMPGFVLVDSLAQRVAPLGFGLTLVGRTHMRRKLLVADFGETERATDAAECGLAGVVLAVDLFGRRHLIRDHVRHRQRRARDWAEITLHAKSVRRDLDQFDHGFTGMLLNAATATPFVPFSSGEPGV